MALSSAAKGKQRAIQERDNSSSAAAPALKRNKSRAETRPCPICKEKIPLRLMGKHAELETGRLEQILQQIGSTEPIRDDFEEDPGTTARGRLSAMKARKSIAPRAAKADSADMTFKTLQSIKRHRKQRHAKLKEMLREEDDLSSGRNSWSRGLVGGQIICPICGETVRGDQGVLDAHVDSCVAIESRRLDELQRQESSQRQAEEEGWESLGETNGNYVGNLQGAGFHTRGSQNQDVDDEVDIDGDDAETFGAPQFTEGDVMHLEGSGDETDADGDIDIDLMGESSSTTPEASIQASSSHAARLNLASMSASKSAAGMAERAILPALTTSIIPTPQPSSPSPFRETCAESIFERGLFNSLKTSNMSMVFEEKLNEGSYLAL